MPAWNKPGANIRPVFLVMHKPFRIKHWDSDNYGWMTAAARGYGSYRAIKTYTARMRTLIRDLQAEGYDGIIQGGSGGTPGEYVVFSASQVISIFDDRAKADSPIIHA